MSGPRTVGRRLVDGLLAFVGLLLLALLAMVAWLTRVPEAPILERATRWPVVAPLAQSFREAYLPPSISPDVDADVDVDAVADAVVDGRMDRHVDSDVDSDTARDLDRASRSIERRHAPPPLPDRGADGSRWVWVPDGAVLRAGPNGSTKTLGVVDGYHRLPRLERRGDWFHVRHGGRTAWIHLSGYRADRDDGPPFGEGVVPPGPLPGRSPDPETLAGALERLDPERRRRLEVGPYVLHSDLPHTDTDDEALLHHLDAVATHVESAYVARYGVEPIDRPRAEIVLYARGSDYRALRDTVHTLPRIASSGHLDAGVVALALEPDREQTVSTFVHEIAHLLNRRALGPALPPWLDEGLADDLAGAAIGADGRLRLGELGGRRVQVGDRIVLTGARASIWTIRDLLDEAADASPAEDGLVRRVLSLEREAFLAGDPRSRYDLAASWIRFLLEADERRADAFRVFLGEVARGGDPSLDALAGRIEASTGEGWPQLERAFSRHVRLRAAALDAWVAQPEAPSEPIAVR